MFEGKFNKEDYTKVVEFLNFIATRAVFKDWTTADSITHFRLLQHMQVNILPKIEANTLEVESIKHAASVSEPEKVPKPSKTKG
jgi:hypothetical protein